jgi:hypothetical protein
MSILSLARRTAGTSLTLVTLIALGAVACGSPAQALSTAPENTFGEGTVQAKGDANGNTSVEVIVKQMSAPKRVASDATVYVVWIQARTGDIQNAGALTLDGDFVGKLNTTTPHRAFTLTVTPEASAAVGAPAHKAVFTSEVNRVD